MNFLDSKKLFIKFMYGWLAQWSHIGLGAQPVIFSRAESAVSSGVEPDLDGRMAAYFYDEGMAAE